MFSSHISREQLTDGSYVYRTALVDGAQTMAEFDGVTEKDAIALAEKIMAALKQHALIDLNDSVSFTY